MSLGRGLGALLTPTSPAGTVQTVAKNPSMPLSKNGVWEVPLTQLTPSADQPRKHFHPQELEELAESIRQHGVLEPILVAERPDGGFEIIAGERRYRAAKIAGLTTMPVVIKKLSPEVRLEVALIENIQRSDLNPIEEAFAYQRLIGEFDLTQQQVAEKVGKSRPVIANTIRLLDLPAPVQNALVARKISMSQARTLLALATAEEQLALLASMLGEKITVRELEQKVALRQQAAQPFRPNDAAKLYLEGKLRSALGAKVMIHDKGEKGDIIIKFHSKEELKDLVKKIIPDEEL